MSKNADPNLIQAQKDIEWLVYACAQATDGRNDVAFANCYAEDGVFDRSGRVFHGHEEIASGLRERAPGLQRRHVFTNLQITIEGESKARGQGYCLVFDKHESAVEGLPPIVADFHDEYVQIDGIWKIQSRVVRRSFT